MIDAQTLLNVFSVLFVFFEFKAVLLHSYCFTLYYTNYGTYYTTFIYVYRTLPQPC